MKKRLSVGGKKRGKGVVMPRRAIGYRSASGSGRAGKRARLCLRPWMEYLLNGGVCPGLRWVDKVRQIFSIVWRHASSNGFDPSEHGDLFYRWAEHTGKLGENKDVSHTSNKSTFRCALNSLKDCIQLTKIGDKKGVGAKRTYQFIEQGHPLYDSKRKGKLQKKYKNQLKEDTPNSPPSSIEQDKASWEMEEHDTGTWEQEQDINDFDYLRIDGTSLASDDQSSSLPAADIAPETSLTRMPIFESSLMPQTSSTAEAIPVGLSGSPLDGINPTVPNLEVLLATAPKNNRKIVTEIQANGIIALELQRIDSTENVQNTTVYENSSLPVFSELGISEYEAPIYHAKLTSGGSVRVHTAKQVALSQPEFVINPALLPLQQQQQSLELSLGFESEQSAQNYNYNLSSGHPQSLEMDNDVNMAVMDIGNYRPDEEGDLLELQPPSVLDQDTDIAGFNFNDVQGVDDGSMIDQPLFCSLFTGIEDDLS